MLFHSSDQPLQLYCFRVIMYEVSAFFSIEGEKKAVYKSSMKFTDTFYLGLLFLLKATVILVALCAISILLNDIDGQ